MEIAVSSVFVDGVLLNIFDFLSIEDLAHCSTVCKQWNKIAKDERIWNAQRGSLVNSIHLDCREAVNSCQRKALGDGTPETKAITCRAGLD